MVFLYESILWATRRFVELISQKRATVFARYDLTDKKRRGFRLAAEGQGVVKKLLGLGQPRFVVREESAQGLPGFDVAAQLYVQLKPGMRRHRFAGPFAART
jgi:hypothetical protein